MNISIANLSATTFDNKFMQPDTERSGDDVVGMIKVVDERDLTNEEKMKLRDHQRELKRLRADYQAGFDKGRSFYAKLDDDKKRKLQEKVNSKIMESKDRPQQESAGFNLKEIERRFTHNFTTF